MKTFTLLILLQFLCFIQNTFGQNTDKESLLRTQNADSVQGWKNGGVAVLNISQSSLTNWAAGGQNSLSVNGLISIYAKLKKDKSFWDNSLDVGYGVLKQGKGTGYLKTDDKIDFLSSYGRKAAKNWYYAAIFNFKTQMAAGYNYPNDSVKISDFLAPAYLIAAIGMDYKPNNYFSAFLSPVSEKTIIVKNQALADVGAFGVDPAKYDVSGNILQQGKKIKNELGAYIRVSYSKNDFKPELLKNLAFATKLDLFTNYLDKPQNIVVNWELLITMKVNKFISANINTDLIYDDKVNTTETMPDGTSIIRGAKIQFKEILGIGISYKF